MRVLCVFVLASILFEGFIILCNGGNVKENRKNPAIEVCSNQSELPNPLIAEILFRAGFETIKNAAHGNMRSEEAICRIFEENIIIIRSPPSEEHEEITEFKRKGKRYLEIQSYGKLMRLFEHFGEYVRKIHLHYNDIPDDMRRYINENIIKKYAKKLTELKIDTPQRWRVLEDNRIWQEISNENGEILFPKVKKFSFEGRITKNPFNMSSIFPKLEILKLNGGVDDINCLPNVRQLKKLSLTTESIEEEQLVNIIANNKKLTRLKIWNKHRKMFGIRTVQSIANNLKDLKKLTFQFFGTEFFVPTTNKVYNFTSVTSFCLFGGVQGSHENVSFDMPNLENLKLVGGRIANRISNFINRFEKLKTVHVQGLLTSGSSMRCIESLIHVKEITTRLFENSQLSSLRTFFQNFDKTKSNLRTLKLFALDPNFDSDYSNYEATMNEINNQLKTSKKPTWKISKIYLDQPGEHMGYYLVFKRDP